MLSLEYEIYKNIPKLSTLKCAFNISISGHYLYLLLFTSY